MATVNFNIPRIRFDDYEYIDYEPNHPIFINYKPEVEKHYGIGGINESLLILKTCGVLLLIIEILILIMKMKG